MAELAVAVGVPEIKPVAVENVNPETASDGEIEYESAGPPELFME